MRDTIAYTQQRHAFGASLIENQAIHFRLAELLTEIEALRALCYDATEHYIAGDDITLLASMAKEMLTDSDPLVQNIREKGLLQPIIVAPTGTGRYRIVAGHKRFLACQTLGWPVITISSAAL